MKQYTINNNNTITDNINPEILTEIIMDINKNNKNKSVNLSEYNIIYIDSQLTELSIDEALLTGQLDKGYYLVINNKDFYNIRVLKKRKRKTKEETAKPGYSGYLTKIQNLKYEEDNFKLLNDDFYITCFNNKLRFSRDLIDLQEEYNDYQHPYIIRMSEQEAKVFRWLEEAYRPQCCLSICYLFFPSLRWHYQFKNFDSSLVKTNLPTDILSFIKLVYFVEKISLISKNEIAKISDKWFELKSNWEKIKFYIESNQMILAFSLLNKIDTGINLQLD